MAIRPGDAVVLAEDPGRVLIRVEKVTPETRVSIGGARMFVALSGLTVVHGRAQRVGPFPVSLYRHASDEEIAAAEANGTLPPAP
jgi:hypothetical protein